MNIRLATLSDVEIISKIYQDFYAFHANLQPTYYKEVEESGKYPDYIIKSENEDIIIAEINNNVVGFVHVLEDKTPPYDCIVPHRFAVCVDLFVFPFYRKKGIGTNLINMAKEWAKKRNLDYIELKVLIENENATRLYKQEDFQTVSHTMRCLL